MALQSANMFHGEDRVFPAHPRTYQYTCRSFGDVPRVGVWFGFVRFALLLAVVLRCFVFLGGASARRLRSPSKNTCRSVWVCCDGTWFAFVRSALRLAVVLSGVDRCFGSWVLLCLFFLFRTTQADGNCSKQTTILSGRVAGKTKPNHGFPHVVGRMNHTHKLFTFTLHLHGCGPGSPELSKSYMDMASKLFTFTFTFTWHARPLLLSLCSHEKLHA